MQELEYEKIGARIRRIRETKGWSQKKLAEKCGVSLNFIGYMERGTRHMSLDTFARLCKVLEISADTLLWDYPRLFETEIQSVWGQASEMEENSYSMYVKIMKSVADILNDKTECRKV